MTESLRERCIKAMAVNDHPDLLKVAEHHLDRLLDVLEESAKEVPASIVQKAWRCLNCGTDHGEARCGEPLPVLWRAFTIDDLLAVLRGNGE